jgi:membrane protease YdiL (CAAX protease family)
MAAKKKKRTAPYREPAATVAVSAAPVVTWPYFLIGTVLMTSGAGTLIYPLLLTRTELGEIGGNATYGPIAAVALMAAGIATFVLGLNRRGMVEAQSAIPWFASPIERWFLLLPPLFMGLFVYRTWRELDAEAERERAARIAEGKKGYDWRPLAALISGAVFLSLMEYYGHSLTMRELFDYFDPPFQVGTERSAFMIMLRDSPFLRLQDFVWWSGWRVLGFFLLPAFVIKVILREKIADYGLQTAGFLPHAWIYGYMLLLVLPSVVIVSYTEEFSTYYPFYRDADRSWYDFWTWEVLYAAQFFSLEFFFRGFWLKACKRMMGSGAIFAMVVPYCMIHFGKPFLETLGAILAGLALGSLALRTRSIWSGFLIHVTVAVSMDLAALAQTTGLPDRWWPDL